MKVKNIILALICSILSYNATAMWHVSLPKPVSPPEIESITLKKGEVIDLDQRIVRHDFDVLLKDGSKNKNIDNIKFVLCRSETVPCPSWRVAGEIQGKSSIEAKFSSSIYFILRYVVDDFFIHAYDRNDNFLAKSNGEDINKYDFHFQDAQVIDMPNDGDTQLGADMHLTKTGDLIASAMYAEGSPIYIFREIDGKWEVVDTLIHPEGKGKRLSYNFKVSEDDSKLFAAAGEENHVFTLQDGQYKLSQTIIDTASSGSGNLISFSEDMNTLILSNDTLMDGLVEIYKHDGTNYVLSQHISITTTSTLGVHTVHLTEDSNKLYISTYEHAGEGSSSYWKNRLWEYRKNVSTGDYEHFQEITSDALSLSLNDIHFLANGRMLLDNNNSFSVIAPDEHGLYHKTQNTFVGGIYQGLGWSNNNETLWVASTGAISKFLLNESGVFSRDYKMLMSKNQYRFNGSRIIRDEVRDRLFTSNIGENQIHVYTDFNKFYTTSRENE